MRNRVGRVRSVLALVLAGGLLCSCHAVYEEGGWVGLTEAQMLQRLGAPSDSVTLRLTSDSGLYEHQSGLARFLPKQAGEVVELKEVHWEGLLKETAVWLREDEAGQWVVVETLVWRRGVVF